MKRVLLGITGGIAAYKTLELITLLKKEDIEVFVMMTDAATKMVNPHEFEKASGNKVYTELFESEFDYRKILQDRRVDHVELADEADVISIVPATANTIAKLAYGIADNFLTTTVLASASPLIICPSMNVHMWNNPRTQENIALLKHQGYQIIEPTTGMLACGYEGKGKLENIHIIKGEILRQLERTSSLHGKKVLVTAGGSIERIDNVRYIANRSSGKMGIAIAEECYLRGADVLLLRAKSSVQPRFSIKEEVFATADDLFKLVKKHVRNFHIFYHVAAVSDFYVENYLEGKLSSKSPALVKLAPRKKILDSIKKLNPQIRLIAFKAEYGLTEEELLSVSVQRLKESSADVIVANDISKSDQGFESENNEVYIISANNNVKRISHTSKKEIAKQIIDLTS